MTEPHNHVSAESCDLKPCPFCGGKGRLYQRQNAAALWHAACENCDAGPHSELGKDEAIKRWNRRMLNAAQAAVVPDPFNRKQVEAVCRAVCNVEGLDPDDAEWTGGDPPWTRYADAVASALASQPSPAATVNKKTRCESCNLLEPCADPQCPNSLTRSSAATEYANWTLHRQPNDQIIDHKFSIWSGEHPVVLANEMPGEEGVLAYIVSVLNEPQSVKVTDLSSRQLALAGEYVKEGHPMEDAIRMAHEAGDPK